MRVPFIIATTILLGVALIGIGQFTRDHQLNFINNPLLNRQLNYQLITFSIALLLAFITSKSFQSGKELLTFGKMNAPTEKLSWLGIKPNNTWRKTTLQLLFAISIPTAVFMGLGIMNAKTHVPFSLQFVPFILLFAAMNAFTEEIIFRHFLISGLESFLPPKTIYILSGILFGIPHYFGAPGGLIGVFMAGILGYVLAKATVETRGLGVAWIIHFVQDVIIFSALFVLIAN